MLLVLISTLLASPVLSVISTPALDCWKALSFDGCTVQDATGICSSKFQQDAISDADYRLLLFNYLIERYATQTVGVSIDWIITQTLSPLNSTYATYLDTTYGTSCSTDSDIASLLSTDVAEVNAQAGRMWWLLLMQQAMFCTENEMWVLNQGCVCKEDKDCDQLSESDHSSMLKAIGLVLAIIIIIQIFTYVSLVRQIWAIFGGYQAVKSSIEFLAARLQPSSSSSSTASSSSSSKHISSQMLQHRQALGGGVVQSSRTMHSHHSHASPPSPPPYSSQLRHSPSLSNLSTTALRNASTVTVTTTTPTTTGNGGNAYRRVGQQQPQQQASHEPTHRVAAHQNRQVSQHVPSPSASAPDVLPPDLPQSPLNL